ncbi:Lipase, GDSL [Corchorus olitorius]|uniref:Lipase, GDSL n=1 Tax=Corchorus olitorius TaxID=93759 RepID=A0A1R3ILK0_9ROSI|nr:Lipase, GDSL [Corchorus olitorius]
MSFNGVDYPYSQPTGRFSNGLNTADQIVALLGLTRSPPPFLYLVKNMSSFQQNILQGVNFASGGSGILNTTGLQFNKSVCLEEQIDQFSTVRSNITHMTQDEAATDEILSKAFFLISIGSNDIFEFLSNLTNLSLPEFNATMLSNYETHLRRLIYLGARKFGILTVPPIGCTPFARANFSPDGNCSDSDPANQFAQGFYVEAEALLKKLSSEFRDMRYSLGNTYLMTTTMMEDMYAFGFKDISSACCGNGTYPCNQTATLCANRDEYLFWDRFHPSQRASELAALTLFGASQSFVSPMNFSQLLGFNM